MHIIRFISDGGQILHGEPKDDRIAAVLDGTVIDGFRRTTQTAEIRKLLAPIVPTDIICIGRNYPTAPAPKEAASDERPASNDPGGTPQREEDGGDSKFHDDATLEVFLKPSTALQNPNDPIGIPHFNGLDPQLDCEGELTVIIGRETRNVREFDALNHVFGYTIANDVTARAFQTPTGPPIWMRGKGFDTFCPLGPVIVTADEIADPQSLAIRTLINGQVVRDGNTRDMIRTVPQIIAALSRHMTLRAGAVILTGAPPAIPRSRGLSKGDRVSVQIDRLGSLESSCLS